MKPVAWMASYQWRGLPGGNWQTAKYLSPWQKDAETWLDGMRACYEGQNSQIVEYRRFVGPIPLVEMKEIRK